MKKVLALMMIGAFLLAILPNAMAYFPVPTPGAPEFAKKINGQWTDAAHPLELVGLHACDTIEVEIMVLFFKDLYAYEFTVTWDPAWLSLVNHEVKHIHTADFVIKEKVDAAAGTYTQAVTAINPALGWGDGTMMAAVANLFFHLDNDKQWPGNHTLTVCFSTTKATDSCTEPIPHEKQGGYIKLVPVQPTIKMLPPIVYKSVKGVTFEVQFEIQDIIKMKSFHFIVTWDPTQLKTDAQNVWIKDFLPPPYEYVFIGFPADGKLEITVQMPCEKPPRNGTGELFGIRFTTKVPPSWKDGIPPYDFEENDHPIWYPIPCWNYINIEGYIDKDTDPVVYQYLGAAAGVRVKGPNVNPLNPPTYTLNGNVKDKFVYSDGVTSYTCQWGGYIIGYYELRPIPGDLDLDGHADIVDLSAMAKVYGNADTGFDLDGSGFVDLADVVIVAKNICRTEPDPDLPWPIFDP